MTASFRPGRYAAIDIGTVTCRMLVADVSDADGHPRLCPLAKEYAVTNLGEGVDETKRLSHAALMRVTNAVDSFLRLLATFDVQDRPIIGTTVVATSASRDAENSDEFVAMLASRGLDLAVIPGETEAGLSFMGASAAYAGERVAVVDVGGGSTEISLGVGGENPLCSYSFDVGCRRATERFWDGYPPSPLAIEAVRDWAHAQFEQWFARVGDPFVVADVRQDGGDGPAGSAVPGDCLAASPFRLIAVAGTATSTVAMRDGIEPYDPSRIDGASVSIADLHRLSQHLMEKTLPQLESTRGLDPRRAPVICAGMVILEEAMSVLGATCFTASESDILDGMIMYNSSHQE